METASATGPCAVLGGCCIKPHILTLSMQHTHAHTLQYTNVTDNAAGAKQPLTCSGQLSYLGTSWRKDVAFAGYGVPLQGDITAGKMIFGVDGADPERRAELVRLLDIDLYQRLTTMSDGQRRRVQIAMGLLKPYDVSNAGCWVLLLL